MRCWGFAFRDFELSSRSEKAQAPPPPMSLGPAAEDVMIPVSRAVNCIRQNDFTSDSDPAIKARYSARFAFRSGAYEVAA